MKKLIAAVFGLMVFGVATSADAHWRKCYYPPVAAYCPPPVVVCKVPVYTCGPAGCAPRVTYVPRVAYAVPYAMPYAPSVAYLYGYGYAPAYYRGW